MPTMKQGANEMTNGNKIIVDLDDAPAFIYGLQAAGAAFHAEQEGKVMVIYITGV